MWNVRPGTRPQPFVSASRKAAKHPTDPLPTLSPEQEAVPGTLAPVQTHSLED